MNWELIRHPTNWIIVMLMLAFVFAAFAIINPYDEED